MRVVTDQVALLGGSGRSPSAAQRAVARLGVLAEVGLLLASPGDHVTILQKLTEIAVPALGERCAVHAVGDAGALEPLAMRHADPARPPLLDPEACGIARVAVTGVSEWGPLSRHEFFVAVPLIVRGRVLGVLSLVRSAEYDADERAFTEELARRVAMYVDNAMLLREVSAREAALRDEALRLETLNRIGQRLAALHDLDAIVDEVCAAASELTSADLGVYLTFDERGTQLAVRGATAAELEDIEQRRAELAPDALAPPGVVRVDDVARALPAPPLGVLAGVPRIASYLAVPVRGRRGDVLGVIALGRARTGAFDLRDEELVVGLASLTATATDRARLFGQARELIAELEKSNRDLDQFAYVTSHDLRAPLRGIANLASWIEEDLGERLTPTSRQHLHLLRGRVQRLDDLIQGVLEYSRAGRVADEPVDIELGALVREVIELLAPPDSFAFEIAPDLPVVRSARVPLQQVLMNLIGNAIKHATSPAPSVAIGAVRRGDTWEIFVRDNGPGIAPRHHERIWGLFQTLCPRDRLESTGIGLAIVRRIVEAHGGRAWVESREGEGATFRFTWPGTPPAAPAWR